MYKRKLQVLSCNHCCSGKAISITYSECVSVALVIQHSKLMRHIVLSSVAFPSLQYFTTLSHKRHCFLEQFIEHKMCILIFSTNLPETVLILTIIQRDIIKNVQTSSCKVPVILVGFQCNLILVDRNEFSRRNQRYYKCVFRCKPKQRDQRRSERS